MKLTYNHEVEKELKKHGFETIGSFACKGYNTLRPINLLGRNWTKSYVCDLYCHKNLVLVYNIGDCL